MPFFKLKSFSAKNKGKANLKSGTHTVYEVNGNCYSGEWKDNLKDGYGTQVWKKENLKYEGFWREGKRCGRGTLHPLSQKKGDIYNGLWRKDKRDGHGIQQYSDGGNYDGKWLKDKRDDFGRMQYSDGSCYVGEWYRDKRCGRGTMSYANGATYVGNWERDKRCGKGTLITEKKNKYKGTWLDDMKAGDGTYTFQAEGMRFEGFWVKGAPCCGTLSIDSNISDPRRLQIPECTLKDQKQVLKNAKKYYMELIKDEK